jgi:ribonuclease HII
VYRGQALVCGWEFEDIAREEGLTLVAGIDEVGRGALCGPVMAAAVILPRDFDVQGVDDSKRLTRLQREALDERIRGGSDAWALGSAGPEEIDRLNILRATHLAVKRAVDSLALTPQLALVDGREVTALPVPQRAIVKGDARSVSIAAASIIAKVARDAVMAELDGKHPGYDLTGNVGYASARHLEALRRLGPSPVHRQTFQGAQRLLF